MSIDKVKPLKIENPATGGTQTDFGPTEVTTSQDYLAAKGIAFNNDDNFLIDHVGTTLAQKEPYTTFSVNYNVDNTVNYVEYFNSDTQITANRIYRTDLTYNGNKTVNTETTVIYDVDGSTVLRTYIYTYSYSGLELSSGTVIIND